jgi:capsular polysaccharide biosynthesis protein
MELIEFFRVIRKRIWMLLSIIVASSFLAGAYSIYLVSPTYEASTKLLINYNGNLNKGPQGLDREMISTNMMVMGSYKEIIESEAILNKVAEQHPEFGLTGKALLGRVSSKSTTDSQIMTINVLDSSNERAVSIANAVANVFKKEIPQIMNLDNVTILSAANPEDPANQVSPNPPLNIVMAFLLSSMFGIGLVFLLEYLDDTIKTEADVERVLGLPNLTIIHTIRKSDLASKSKKSAKPPHKTKNQSAGEPSYATINQ